ncbi:8-oxoguanine deaminase [Leekyejoonella antrihumi]|uniref:8-oxoguanine deaminase n=1 Tax=Leekyejoonella antrihumi TaxID=1660198 RepID=A0A563DWE7_9MICO|nr:8-oxoguanine deaminase [Leekyejoonella antrihumi]TWP34536.1 8-oxoguanine deaminase [Leekyejoonella antrihumi]
MTVPQGRRTILDGCTVVTMDPDRTEHRVGHVVLESGRITGVGAGPAPEATDAEVIDARGCVATPGLVNAHHHLYQWVTRGMAVDDTLFDWLVTLYPVWGGIDEDIVRASATAGLAWLARTGCTTTMDHHYVFPKDGGDLLGAEIDAASQVGLRFLPTRGSMDLGRRDGGLPPDHVVEDIDTILAASMQAVDRWHDDSPDSMLRIGLAPCSPFSVTGDLLRASAELARDQGVRLHTHLAETLDEEEFCRDRFGCSPVEYMESLGWLGGDVWIAHGIHLDDDAVRKVGASGTGVAHCPSSNGRLGAGICRSRDLRDAGAPVGLGVDGSASNEASDLLSEARMALLFARAKGGPKALSVRDTLEMATIGGARALGWDRDIGSLEVGKQADIALWRVDTLPHVDILDAVAGLVLGSNPPLERLLVAGRTVVERDRLVTVDEDTVTARSAAASRTLLARAGVSA